MLTLQRSVESTSKNRKLQRFCTLAQVTDFLDLRFFAAGASMLFVWLEVMIGFKTLVVIFVVVVFFVATVLVGSVLDGSILDGSVLDGSESSSGL